MNIICLAMWLCATWSAWAGATAGYDEAYDERGRARAPYGLFQATYGVDVLNPAPNVTAHMLGRPLGDAQKAAPIPLILSHKERRSLQRGVVQRAEVYRAFFHDVVSGDQRIFAASDPSFRALIEHLFRTTGHSLAHLRRVFYGLPLESVRFMYAPDLIRSPEGRWVVLEDNIGELPGGVADLDQLRASFMAANDIEYPGADLIEDLVEHFLAATGGGRDRVHAIYNEHPQRMGHRDDEHFRVARALRKSLVEAHPLIKEQNIEYEQFANTSLMNLTPLVNHSRPTEFLKFARAAATGEIRLMESLGIEILTSKVLLTHLDRLAEFYLGQELILKSPPSYAPTTETELMAVLDKEHGRVVIKAGFGRAGAEVYFWDDLDEAERDELIDHVEREAAWAEIEEGTPLPGYVVQRAVEASHVPLGPGPNGPRARIDVRPMVYVGTARIAPPTHFWGRATTPFGDRRHNVNQGGLHLVVLPGCATFLEN